MNKKSVISKISEKTGIHKSVIDVVLKSLFDTLLNELQKGEDINFAGFGRFYTAQRMERKYTSFQTGEIMMSSPHLVPKIKFSKNFTDKF